jgi:hypothetical protein
MRRRRFSNNVNPAGLPSYILLTSGERRIRAHAVAGVKQEHPDVKGHAYIN